MVNRKTSQQIYACLRGRVAALAVDEARPFTGEVAIHRHQNQFARGKNHVNGIESFWSYAKFRFLKLRGVRPQFFLLHLKESEWR